MSFIKSNALRLIKSEDLNHHGTLFAGRCAEWFVESGFIAVAQYLKPQNVVCLKIHGMEFLSPVKPGDIIKIESQIVLNGKSTLIAYVEITNMKNNIKSCDGFMTFCHVDEHTRPKEHGITVIAESDADRALQEKAIEIKKQR